MKTILFPILLIIFLAWIACDQDDLKVPQKIGIISLGFTGCITVAKADESPDPYVHLTGEPGNKLRLRMGNTEFCCGTDSISLRMDTTGNTIRIEIIDEGPYTYCYCAHDLEILLGPLEKEVYDLTLIESEHAYSRDTFTIHFAYSEQLDTIITNPMPHMLLGDYPLEYASTQPGGCNGMGLNKLADRPDFGEQDTIIFTVQADSLIVFVGLNQTCCIDFASGSENADDTLRMWIETQNDEFCDCICYYTFDYKYTGFSGQGFYYQFLIDGQPEIEGMYNLPASLTKKKPGLH